MSGHITIIARRWFDKINGNTYHSVHVVMPDGSSKAQGLTYGYGSQYEVTAFKLVLACLDVGQVPRHENGHPVWPWKWYQEHGYTVSYDVADVARKKDLHRGEG